MAKSLWYKHNKTLQKVRLYENNPFQGGIMVIRVNLTHALATLSPRSGNGVIILEICQKIWQPIPAWRQSCPVEGGQAKGRIPNDSLLRKHVH